jgi:hypothetical protein
MPHILAQKRKIANLIKEKERKTRGITQKER